MEENHATLSLTISTEKYRGSGENYSDIKRIDSTWKYKSSKFNETETESDYTASVYW